MNEIIYIINLIQKVKDWSITDEKLIIFFEESILLFRQEMINYHLKSFEGIIEPTLYSSEKEFYINLKK